MDQLKEFWGLFRRQHFWFLAPVILILAVVGWVMASGQVTDSVKSQISTIGGHFSKARQVTSVNTHDGGHPNETWAAGMEQLIANRRQKVEEAWQTKWQRQQKILTWPDDAFGPNTDAKQKAEKLRPIEKVDINTDDVFTLYELGQYKRFAREQLPRLAEKIGSVWNPSRRAGSGRRGNEGNFNNEDEEQTQIVLWNPQNQAEIDANFDWGDAVPSTLEVLYAQEDIWVLNAIVDIIKTVNGDARTRATASIKEIVSLRYGKDVQKQTFRITPPKPLRGGDPTGGDDDDDDVGMDYDTGEPETDNSLDFNEGGDNQGEPTKVHPAIGRYVDADYQPINDQEALLTSVAVAKRIPVRLRVIMDQRHINQLLVACANSELTCEVQQLRINPREGVSASRFGGGGGGGFASHSGSFGNQRGYEGGLGGSRSAQTLENIATFDRVVEIYGIIYIFNPVSKGASEESEGEA